MRASFAAKLWSLVGGLALLGACADEAPAPRPPNSAQMPRGWVRVRLAEGELVELGCDGAWSAHAVEASQEPLGDGPSLPRSTPLSAAPEGLALGPLSLARPTVELRAARDGDLRVGTRAYRGVLRLERLPGRPGHAARVRVTNLLPVDAYLRGVVPGEMPERFGLTALAAQAVAARSYALNEMQHRGWLWADARSQVYGGVSDETRLTDRAVESTRGVVLVHDDAILAAWFHSTCGGGTRPAREVFPNPPAGVLEERVSCDDCSGSRFYAWERRLPAERVAQAFRLEQPQLVAFGAEPESWPAYAERVMLRTPSGEAELDAERFRARVSAGVPRDEQLLSTRWRAAPEIVDGELLVRGAGWGHGVGLCQHGAAGAAARGMTTFEILRRYYPGAELVRLQ